MVQLCTYGIQHDPECWAILQTFKDAREFAQVTGFQADLVAYAHRRQVTNGPVGVFVARAERLGWNLQQDGMFSDALGVVDILHCAWDELWLRVRRAWMDVVGTEVLHRDSMEGLHQADLYELHQSLKLLDAIDQSLLRAHLDGTLYTQLGRAHMDEAVSSQCPWCSHRDGFFHRAWECERFADERSHVPHDLLQKIHQLPRCLTCHGWPVRPPELDSLEQALLLIPPPEGKPPVNFHGEGRAQYFTDGSCSSPKNLYCDWQLGLSRWSLVVWALTQMSSCKQDMCQACCSQHTVQSCGASFGPSVMWLHPGFVPLYGVITRL